MRLILLPLLLLSTFCFAQVDLNLGLRAYYPFSGNASDVSGNNNHPVFNNATLTADRFGTPNSAYHFNGVDNYMRIPNNPTLNMGNTMSISLWVKPTAYYTGSCYTNMLVMKSSPATLQSNYHVRFADVYNGCTTPNPAEERFAGNNVVAQTPFVQLNQWYSVVWTSDGVTERIYVNCVLRESVPAGGIAYTNTFDLLFGMNVNPSFPYWLNGDLDEVRLYNRALTQDEVNVLGGCITQTPCTNWLNTPGFSSYATVGDLDVAGNQITIEATYNRTEPLNGGLYPGHLVSKHTDVSNVNYALFPNGCSITTTTGYKETFETCGLGLNKTYHAAMVYDGIFLKFYRNGFLITQVACTGNMILNDLPTTIAQYAGTKTVTQQFMGYVNEVRIWNVARTQSQIRTYMNNSLPNPATTPGLLGYYTFDNLQNKQGNAAYNATLSGTATINTTNTSCSFVADSCVVPVACSNWLNTPTFPSTASIGNLNVTGNQITVEGSFNCTNYSTPNYGGNLIAKHTNPSNVSYALSPHAAEISTSNNGYVFTLQTCPFLLNKTYHAAMVYDGTSLKFYRDGFLMSQIPCTGNISTNSFPAIIGNGPALPLINQFFGQINEIRIWNIARTQAQLQTYMNSSLPNPTTQTGLLAYYTFDNLLNKQGNTAWNATLGGSASINATNPACTFTADSCAAASTSVIINDYTPVLGFNPCNNALTVENGTAYNVGDTVLLIQMKGAVIDSSNTAAFGTVTDFKNSGNYEFNYVKSRTGNIIELSNALTRQYDIPVGKVQLIRVPYFIDLSTNDTITCLPWDGNKGGVLAFNVQNTLTLNADIDVSGRGFRGGVGYNPGNASLICNQNNYNYPVNTLFAGQKGESITTISSNILSGKGSPAAGGGGGLGHNSGGGGGGNAGIGGLGGYQLEPCGSAPFDNRGVGGRQLPYSTAANKIYLGSGGGAGHADNPGNIPPGGGNGAGIIIVSANAVRSNTRKIKANGAMSVICSMPSSPDCHDATGGGGAGGTVVLNVNQFLDNTTIENKGGKAADVIGGPISIAGRIGPGGGGAGGLAFLKSASLPPNVTVTNTGGLNGVLTQDANNPWGATAGTAGQNLFNLVLPVDNIPFRKNIDSVRIKDSLLNCNGFDFKGLGYTNTNPIATWEWFFGDGGTANTQNTTHAYGAAGTYSVKLVVTDITGCKDSTMKDVVATAGIVANAGTDTAFCSNGTVTHMLQGSGAGTYSWTPAIFLNDPTIANPTATVSSTTTFYLTVTGASACTSVDSVTISVNPLPLVQTLPDTSVCKGSLLVLTTTTGAGTYNWSPGMYVSNPTIASPTFIDTLPRTLVVTRTNAQGCFAKDTININVKPLPPVKTIEDTLICSTNTLTLVTSGAQSYSWSPAVFLSDPNVASPVFSGNTTQTYFVTGTGSNGCMAKDTVTVSVNIPRPFLAPPGKFMCSQNSVELDGFNGNMVDYLWRPANYLSSTTIINPVTTTPFSTVYSVTITDRACNTDSSFNVTVTVYPTPVVSARKSNDVDCALRSATLGASGGNQYTWFPATGLSSTSIANPVATPAHTQEYFVQVTNAAGCSNTDSVTVFVNNTASLARYMPNAFTPNGDGKNDCYGLKNWMYIQQLQFFIFNRYGEQVFGTANPGKCWDGMYKGKPALAGTYVFVIRAKTSCGTEEQKGNFLLIR